jgi:hypothetical protein
MAGNLVALCQKSIASKSLLFQQSNAQQGANLSAALASFTDAQG